MTKCPTYALQVLRNEAGSAALLRSLLYRDVGSSGGAGLATTRLSALLNAALGYVAAETTGFIDFDSVPEEGATTKVS